MREGGREGRVRGEGGREGRRGREEVRGGKKSGGRSNI